MYEIVATSKENHVLQLTVKAASPKDAKKAFQQWLVDNFYDMYNYEIDRIKELDCE